MQIEYNALTLTPLLPSSYSLAEISNVHLDSGMEKEKKALQFLAEEGWFFNPEIPISILHELELQITKKPEGIWDWFDNFFRNHLNTIESRLIGSYPKRTRFFKDGFYAHKQSKYSLSVPVFLSQADGIFSEIFPRKSLFISAERKSAINPHTSLDENEWVRIFLYPLSLPLPLWMPESQRKDSFSGLNRHQVLHGESVSYDTERNSLKSVSLLGYLHWVSSLLDDIIGLE